MTPIKNKLENFKWTGRASFFERKTIPYDGGVYAIEVSEEVVYIGISDNIRRRILSHNKVLLLRKSVPVEKISFLYLVEKDSIKQRGLEYPLIGRYKPSLNHHGRRTL